MSNDFSDEYLSNLQADEKARLKAWAQQKLANSNPTSDDPVVALMAESNQAGLDSRADFDPLKGAREAQYGSGSTGVRGASKSLESMPLSVGRNIAETPRGVGHGAIAGVNEAVRTVYDLADWARSNSPDWLNSLIDHGLEADFRDAAGGYNLIPSLSLYHGAPGPEGVPQLPNFTAPETMTGNLVSDVTKFLAGFAAGGEVLQPVKAAGTAGKVVKAMGQGAISDFAFFDPHEERLANLIQQYPALTNPVTEYLAANEGDGQLEGRLKRAVEGMGLGAATEGVIRALGAGVRAIKKGRAAKAKAAASPEAADAVFKEMNEAVAPEP